MRTALHTILANFTDLVLSEGSGSPEVREFQVRYQKDGEIAPLLNSVLELRANLARTSLEEVRSNLLNATDLAQARAQAQARARLSG